MKFRRKACEYLVTAAALHIAAVRCFAEEPTQTNWAALEDTKVSISFNIKPPSGEAVSGVARIAFTNKYAVSAYFDPNGRYGENWTRSVLFDLEQMAWYNVAPKRWISLTSCQEWERASIEHAKASLEKAPDSGMRAFVKAMIDPRLDVRKNPDGTFVLSNSHLSYAITPAPNITPQQLARFVAYDRLNAYQKAMTDRQLPPTAQMAVDNLLAEQRVFPSQMISVVKTGKGNITSTTDARFEAYDATDTEIVRKAFATVTP